jgi:hypothetical protein
MKHGAIIGRDVVSLGKTHHIMRSWRSEGGVGTTLCGLKVAIGFGVDGVWENVPTGKWEVEKDCGTCLRVLAGGRETGNRAKGLVHRIGLP